MYTIMYTFELQCTLYRCKEEFNPPAWFHCTASLNHLMLVFSGKILTFKTLFTDSTLLIQLCHLVAHLGLQIQHYLYNFAIL